MSEWATKRARESLRIPRPCHCFIETTLGQLPACRDGLCADVVRSITAALDEAAEREREMCAKIADEAASSAVGRGVSRDAIIADNIAAAIREASGASKSGTPQQNCEEQS